MDTVDDDEVLGGGAVDEAHSEAKDREVLAVVEVLEPGSLLVPPSEEGSTLQLLHGKMGSG